MTAGSLLLAPVALTAQYNLKRLDGAVFREDVHSDIITQSGTAERRRTVLRSTTFGVVALVDTLIVTADTVQLSESVDGIRESVDVDAVIGARWTLTLNARGSAAVMDRPVVPALVADVSDIGTAMDDFFPAAPPRLAVGATITDSTGRRWRRLGDSSAIERYHYSSTRRASTRTVGDSVTVESSEDGTENSDLAWEAARGPMSWTRNILTNVTTHFAGRTVRAQVDQRIVVRRGRR